jgi:hypothetical protein
MFDVIYDDGDRDVSLSSASVYPFTGYTVGENLQAGVFIDGKQVWFSGTVIQSDEENKRVTLVFDDGAVDEFPFRALRRLT